MIGSLFGLLNRGDWKLSGAPREVSGARVVTLSSKAGETFLLVLPPPGGSSSTEALAGRHCRLAVDLDTGTLHDDPPDLLAVPTALFVS